MIDLERVPDLAALSDDELLQWLRLVAADLEATTARQTTLYELRLAGYKAGRDREPVITQVRLAEAASVTEVAVIQSLREDRKRTELAEAHDRGEHPERARGCPRCSPR